ncbi:hypothetical protein EV127DRAFT_510725 [Xylaria flabelliformis]|nr:hypothetical protein EV127DRAFT_510725 [Xylaria flabelliformis]
MPPSKGPTTLVVGIDFGTTYSGVSWLICKPGSPTGQPEVVTLWETSHDIRRNNSDRSKVPSKMHYDENGELWWGFKIPAGAKTVEWFKLLLLNDADLKEHMKDSSHLHDARHSLLKLGKTPVQLIGEYLKVLWDHVLEQISRAKGKELINGMPFHVVLTVPAIWTDYARGRMCEAAGLAGIFKHRDAGKTTFSFVSEPEAAAIATIPELEDRADLQVGDSFVVVDAGGGTVDIISYKINTVQPLSVSECVEGEGALCGGTFLDKEFEVFLKNAVGEVSWNKMNESDIRRMMNNEWEHGIKEAFSGEPDYFTIELPSRAQIAQLRFSSKQVQPIFDKIVSQTGALLEKQITAVKAKTLRLPKLVILVGGFGRSPYMFKYLEAKVDNRVTILQSRLEKPWTAICRGAALFGAESCSDTNQGQQPLVRSRIARFNYGWIYETPFVDGIHDPRDKVWRPMRQIWQATNQMQWIVKRGEDVLLKEAKTYDYLRYWSINERGWGRFTENVYACADLNPPSRMEGNVRKVAQFAIRTNQPKEQYKKVRNNNGTYYREWRHSYKVMVSGASLEVTLVSDGKEQKLEKIPIDVN